MPRSRSLRSLQPSFHLQFLASPLDYPDPIRSEITDVYLTLGVLDHMMSMRFILSFIVWR